MVCQNSIKMNFLKYFKPGIPQRYLLLMGALAWTCAGTILLYKGGTILKGFQVFPVVEFAVSIIAGILFYVLLFSKISLKHTERIYQLSIKYPCMFSFFNFRSYILMGTMITGGILLRRSGWVPSDILLIIYFMMGIPLFLSSFRFYTGFIYWHRQPPLS
jgi:hypothetical protein